jgi:phage gp37-like protein
MRYKVAEIEDQIKATLVADTTNFSSTLVDTFAGQVNAQMFFDPEMMQGFVKLLPFCLISYQGRTSDKNSRDSSGKTYIHTLTFRLFVGAQSLRATQDAVRGCYDMLAAVFDDLHGKVPVTSPLQLPGFTPLSGTALTSTEVNVLGPLLETGGQDERLIVNLPGIVVFASDFSIRMLA